MSRLDKERAGAGESLPAALAPTVAPVNKGAFGVAVGCVSGIPVFLLTAFHLLLNPVGGLQLELLSQYFYGYDVTWVGAIVGLAWGWLFGFIGGWARGASPQLPDGCLDSYGEGSGGAVAGTRLSRPTLGSWHSNRTKKSCAAPCSA